MRAYISIQGRLDTKSTAKIVLFFELCKFLGKKNEGKGAFFIGTTDLRSDGVTEAGLVVLVVLDRWRSTSRPSGLLAGTTARSEQEAEHCPSGQAQI